MAAARHPAVLWQEDGLLVEPLLLVLKQLVLKNDRDPRRQRLGVEEVELASLPLLVKEAGKQNGEDEHAGDDDGRNDEGEKVVRRGDDPVEDGVAATG